MTSKTRTRCLLCVACLAITITTISIRELEFHSYDLTSTEQFPLPTIELPPSLRKLKVSLPHTFNSSIHAHNITVISDKNATPPSPTKSTQTPNNTHHAFKPYRTVQHKLTAFQHYLTGNGKIVIIHQRKSGGTTLENWLRAINKRLQTQWNNNHPSTRWNSTVEVREAYHFFHKMPENNLTWSFLTDPYSIYVTSIRHPINRILSQYEFEWRWGCQRCDFAHNVERYKYANMTDWSFMARSGKLSEDYVEEKQYKRKKYAALDFNDWLHRLIKFELENPLLGTPQHSMQSVRAMYVNNYFLWIACCPNRWCNIQRDYIEGKEHDYEIRECFNRAIRILKSFDVVLITEWMNDLRTQVYVNELFFNDSHIEHTTNYIGIGAVNKPYPHHVTDRGKNYMISPENEEILYRLNSWDLKVYQYAKIIAFERVRSVWKDVFDADGDDNFNELLYGKNVGQLLDDGVELNHVFSPYKELLYGGEVL